MKIKLARLLDAVCYFQRLEPGVQIETPFQHLMEARIPGANVTLVQLARVVDKHVATFDEDRRALIPKHGVGEEGAITVPPENMAAFNADLAELINQDVEVPVKKLRRESVEMSGLSAADVAVLSWLVEGLEDDAAPKPATVTEISSKRREKAAEDLPAA